MDASHVDTLTISLGGEVFTIKPGIKALRLGDRNDVRSSYDELMNPGPLTYYKLLYCSVLPDRPRMKEDRFLDLLEEKATDEERVEAFRVSQLAFIAFAESQRRVSSSMQNAGVGGDDESDPT